MVAENGDNRMVLKIIISPKQGMCFGVKRALEIAEKSRDNNKIYTYGPLVHNKEVVHELEKKGILVADSLDGIDKNSTLIIRAHGISDREMRKAEQKAGKVIDATCPFVFNAKHEAKKMEKDGFKVVILGQKEHPEVRGIAESLKSPVIIESANDLERLKGNKKIGLISQTTQSARIFDSIVSGLEKLGAELRIANTICNATSERQESAKETAKKSDIMIVIGDKQSANTIKLAEICSGIIYTKHIEKASELKKEWFAGKGAAGITAGASTPDWIVDGVVESLKKF